MLGASSSGNGTIEYTYIKHEWLLPTKEDKGFLKYIKINVKLVFLGPRKLLCNHMQQLGYLHDIGRYCRNELLRAILHKKATPISN